MVKYKIGDRVTVLTDLPNSHTHLKRISVKVFHVHALADGTQLLYCVSEDGKMWAAYSYEVQPE